MNGFLRRLILICSCFFAATANAGIIKVDVAGSRVMSSLGGTLAVFSFDLGNNVIESAKLEFSNYDIGFLNSARFYLDGVLIGKQGLGIGVDFSFDIADLAVLSDGSAKLTWDAERYLAGCLCVIPEGGSSLTMNTVPVPVPEPSTFALLILGGVGVVYSRSKSRVNT